MIPTEGIESETSAAPLVQADEVGVAVGDGDRRVSDALATGLEALGADVAGEAEGSAGCATLGVVGASLRDEPVSTTALQTATTPRTTADSSFLLFTTVPFC